MIELGRICLVLSFATAGYCIAAALLGTRRRLPGLVQSARNAVLATTVLVLSSGASLLYLLATDRFEVRSSDRVRGVPGTGRIGSCAGTIAPSATGSSVRLTAGGTR